MKYIKLFTLLIFSTIVLFSQDLSGTKVCIDPGHGGHESDDRYMPETGFWESESNLTKGLFLKGILESLGGFVVITRTGNDDPPPTEGYGTPDDPSLSQRAAIANENNVDYFISIHSNGANGQANYTLAIFNGKTNDPRYPLAKTMAQILSEQIYTANRTTTHYAWGDLTMHPDWNYGYGVFFDGTTPLSMPGNISEGSFHDYIPESWRLMSIDYRQKESWAIAQSITNYFEEGDIVSQNILLGMVRSLYESPDYFCLSSLHDQYLPLNNAKVKLIPDNAPEDSVIYYCDDNNNGFFMFDSLESADYQIIIEKENYYNDTASVFVDRKMFNFKDRYLTIKTPPTVVSTKPANNESSFPAWDPIKITFSREMNITGALDKISFSPDADFSVSWENTNTVLWINPDSLGFETEYTVTISSNLTDVYGHNLDGNNDGTGGDDFSITFITSPPDITPPKVVSHYPEMLAHDIALKPVLNVTFDEIINSSSINTESIKLKNHATDTFVAIDILVFNKNNKTGISIFPRDALIADNLHVITISEEIKDMYDNHLTNQVFFTFFTEEASPEFTTIDNFNNIGTNWWEPSQSGSTMGVVVENTYMESNSDTLNPITPNNSASMEIGFQWDLNSGNWLVRNYLSKGAPLDVTFDRNNLLQVYVFGDGGNSKFRFAVDDNIGGSSGTEVSPWYEIDWVGWKVVTWDMSTNETGSWIGDGSLDGKLRVDSFQLTYGNNENAASRGVVFLDDFAVVHIPEVAIDDNNQQVAQGFELMQNYPNPFNPTTNINFAIPQTGNVKIGIYNIQGELVKEFQMGKLSQGNYNVVWNARDNDNRNVACGTYFCRLVYKDQSITQKMLYLK